MSPRRRPDPLSTRSAGARRFNNPESANRVTSAAARRSTATTCSATRVSAATRSSASPCTTWSVAILDARRGDVRRPPVEPDGRSRIPRLDGQLVPPRPARTGPDGALWVVDMYRFVIEHPRWITPERLATLDARAGADKGGSTALSEDRQPRPRSISAASAAQLAAKIDHANGVVRDLIHRELVHRQDKAAIGPLRAVKGSAMPAAREASCAPLASTHASPTRCPMLSATPTPASADRPSAWPNRCSTPHLVDLVIKMSADPDPGVRYQLALALGEAESPAVPAALADLLARSPGDPWTRAAVLSAAAKRPIELLERLRKSPADRSRSEPNWPSPSPRPPRRIRSPGARHRAPGRRQPRHRRRLRVRGHVARHPRPPPHDPPAEATSKLAALLAQARVLANGDTPRADDRFVAALALLGRDPSDADADADLAIAAKHFAASSAPRVQAAAFAILKRSKDPRAADRLVAALPHVSPSLRGQILDTLASRPKSIEAPQRHRRPRDHPVRHPASHPRQTSQLPRRRPPPARQIARRRARPRPRQRSPTFSPR